MRLIFFPLHSFDSKIVDGVAANKRATNLMVVDRQLLCVRLRCDQSLYGSCAHKPTSMQVNIISILNSKF